MAHHIKREMRYFRNHYLCDDCPNEWSDEMAVVGPSFCPCCDRKAEPYDSEPLLEAIRSAPEDVVEHLLDLLRDAGLLNPGDEPELTELDPDRLREMRDERLACLQEIGGED